MSEQDREIEAMVMISKALSGISPDDQDAIDRVLRWALDKYASSTVDMIGTENTPDQSGHNPDKEQGSIAFNDLAELVHAAQPKTDPERALFVSYWTQVIEDNKEFTGQEINSRLKDLGHGVSNITDAMTSLMCKKPALIYQTAKRGTSKQARKRYRLTKEGIRECESRIPQSL